MFTFNQSIPNTRKRAISFHAGLILGIALLELFAFNTMLNLESGLNDTFVRFHAEQLKPDPDIVIVDIDEYSLDGIARKEGFGRYPWPRSLHGDVLEKILEQQPRAVVYDILFSDADNLSDRNDTIDLQGDTAFAKVVKEASNVYYPMLRLPESGDKKSELVLGKFGKLLGFTATPAADNEATLAVQLPVAFIAQTGRLGTVNFFPDDDGVGRRYPLFIEAYGWRIPSLPARVASELGYTIPDQKDLRLHWRGQILGYKRVSFYDVYDDHFNRQTPVRSSNEFTDKLVVIGASAPSLDDHYPSSLGNVHPGVEIVATALANLKNNRFMYEPGTLVTALFTILIIALLYIGFIYKRNPYYLFIVYFIISIAALVIAYLSVTSLVVMPVLRPLVFGWCFYALAALYEYLDERRTRQRSMQMFSRFVDSHVVNDLVSEGEEGLKKYFNSQRTSVSVLFSDIRGFTTMSQHREPEEIVSILNDYFSRQTDVIFHHGGTMDKFIGDAIMAFWGAPISDPDHAQHAVEAALDMVDSLHEFRATLSGELGDTFDIGIGIHSGEAVVGMIGSENKLDYTCIGDTVNTASRLEGQTKGRARILVSAATRESCNDTIGFIEHGAVSVKGRDEPVMLYEPFRKL